MERHIRQVGGRDNLRFAQEFSDKGNNGSDDTQADHLRVRTAIGAGNHQQGGQDQNRDNQPSQRTFGNLGGNGRGGCGGLGRADFDHAYRF